MGIPAVVLGCAEKKKTPQRFLLHNFGTKMGHLFTDNSAFLEGHGHCLVHNRVCNVPAERPDFTAGGLPCQPFTCNRTHTGTSARTGAVSGHPDFSTVMNTWGSYLHIRQPGAFFIEEVPDFNSMSEDGNSYMWNFSQHCVKAGYAVRAMTMNHNVWVNFPRERTRVSKSCALALATSH
jgi:site-specific DNA-cytosine methylase